MLFSPKAQGFFVDYNENGVFVARTSAPKPPFVVEEMREVAKDNATGLAEVLKQLQPKRSRSGYVHATVGMHSEKRFVRRATVDLKRVKEVGYLDEVLQTQFRIEPEKFTAAALRPNDGGEYDAPNATTKDVVLCGIPSDEIVAFQDSLLAQRDLSGSLGNDLGFVPWDTRGLHFLHAFEGPHARSRAGFR